MRDAVLHAEPVPRAARRTPGAATLVEDLCGVSARDELRGWGARTCFQHVQLQDRRHDWRGGAMSRNDSGAEATGGPDSERTFDNVVGAVVRSNYALEIELNDGDPTVAR